MKGKRIRPLWMFISSSLICTLLALPSSGQSGGAGGGSGAASSASAPSGGGAVESAIISYQAANELAKELAARFCGAGTEKIQLKVESQKFLLGTPANLAAIQAWIAFRSAVDQLGVEYDTLAGLPVGSGPPAPHFFAAVSAGASAAITAITAAASAAKAQTTQTASTFTPVDQVLFSDLEREMAPSGCTLVTMAYPGAIASASEAIEGELNDLLKKRGAALAKRDQEDTTKYSADKELQGLDAELATLEQTLGNETPNMNGSIILTGKALANALTDTYHVLTIANAAAGGGTRANVYFLLNILFPAPHPSYNGGAEVAYSLRTMQGGYESADALYFVFGYTKWKQPPLRNQSNQRVREFQVQRFGKQGTLGAHLLKRSSHALAPENQRR